MRENALERVRVAAVLGLGRSGRAATERLLEIGVAVWATDRRPAAELDVADWPYATECELAVGYEPAELPPEIELVVVSPGFSASHPLVVAARRRSLPVWAEIELAYRLAEGEIVAITGTNGKSTTTALTGHLLACAGFPIEVCGNIGRPFAAAIPGPPGRIFVVEVSSFQLETVERFRPRAAAFLNLSPDHLDRHGLMTTYAEVKRRLFRCQRPEDVAVLAADDPWVAGTAVPGRRREFSSAQLVGDGCALVEGVCWEFVGGRRVSPLFAASSLKIPGRHHLENAMAAALLARSFDVSPAQIEAALLTFRGLPHRMELVAEKGGVRFVDDSKGTNLAATQRALEGFPDGSVHLILGGRNKGVDFLELRPVVSKKAARVYLIGEAVSEIARALHGAVPLELSGTLEKAVEAASWAARPGEVVLLSPACASFDQFQDYVERGERFQSAVRAVLGRQTS